MSITPPHQHAAILSEDHDRGMHRTQGRVLSYVNVSPHLARVTLHIPELRDDPQWFRPNVALRLHLPDGNEQVSRIYTVRTATAATNTIEVDVVRHGTSSPVMRWLDQVRVGDLVDLVGPRPHFQFPELHGRELLLFLDATAIPALYALLQQAPPGIRGRGWVATNDSVAFKELPVPNGLELEQLAPGIGYAEQAHTYRQADGIAVWGAGERDEMRTVRTHFRTKLGLPKQDVALFGYWKRGTSNTEIDQTRLRTYETLLAAGGTMTELDDLALPI